MIHYFSVLDLYSGPGGLSEGFMEAKSSKFRFNVVVANEINKDVIATYAQNHPSVNIISGSLVKEEVKKNIIQAIKQSTKTKHVDLIIGGPPCKGFSLANRTTRNASNPLNYLATHFVEMVKRLKPFAFVMENVPGMISLHNGKIFNAVHDELESYGYGNISCWILNAADYGVPQKRKRAFLVGSKSPLPIIPPKQTHGKNDNSKKSSKLYPYVSAGDSINDLPYIAKGKGSSTSNKYRFIPKNKLQIDLRGNTKNVKNHFVTVSRDLVVQRFQCVPQGGNWRNIPKKLFQINGKYKNFDNIHSALYKRLNAREPSITITNFRKAMLIHPTQNRLLSVREAARIQTFPDHFEFKGSLHSMQQQVSDAVPVKLARSVAESMLYHMSQSIIYSNSKSLINKNNLI